MALSVCLGDYCGAASKTVRNRLDECDPGWCIYHIEIWRAVAVCFGFCGDFCGYVVAFHCHVFCFWGCVIWDYDWGRP